MITFDDVIEKEMTSLLYPPIKNSVGKTIKEVKRFHENNFGKYIVWCVIIFTDNTALYLDNDLEVCVNFHRLTETYTDKETGQVSGYIRDCGHSFVENGLVAESILKEAVELYIQYRIEQQEEERHKEIVSLEEKLMKLKNR